ncbi:MAG TPA: histidinol dehydrogenase [Vicinamibacteria bacterium]|nr:histidinol dehydrogenase [Vicinamibacteria bacterium]
MRTLRRGGAGWRRFVASWHRSGSSRPAFARPVGRIVDEVRRDGDRALVRLTARLDGVLLPPRGLRMPPAEVRGLARRAEPALVAALQDMARRIEAFHREQKGRGFRLRLRDGSIVEEVVRPLDSAGLYVPGGSGAYPSSVLMSAIPARVAGVPRLVVATPPRALAANPAVAAAIVLLGLDREVLRVGGAQAIAALAYGTETIAPVAAIVGPGNAWVAEAKRQVQRICRVDAQAGPSEVVVLADEGANAGEVAIDLLAQAEHGSGEERAVLVTSSRRLATRVERLLAAGLPSVSNAAATRRALERHGAVVLVRDVDEGVEAVNALAPEHVEVLTSAPLAVARRIVAGAVFAGRWAPVAVGDYGIGPNHVLPTGGTARRSSPLSVRDFERRQSLVRLTPRGLRRVAAGIAAVARAEGFAGHARSVLMRLP